MHILESSEFRFKNYPHKITGGKSSRVSNSLERRGGKLGGWCWEPAGWGQVQGAGGGVNLAKRGHGGPER